MPESANEQSVRRYWEEVWGKGNMAAVGEFYSHPFLLNGEETSVEDFCASAESWLSKFSDFSTEVDKLFTCEDVVVSRVIYRATHTGDFKTVPATGKPIELSGIDIFEFEDGRATTHWHETDHLEMFQQLGAELRPGSA